MITVKFLRHDLDRGILGLVVDPFSVLEHFKPIILPWHLFAMVVVLLIICHLAESEKSLCTTKLARWCLAVSKLSMKIQRYGEPIHSTTVIPNLFIFSLAFRYRAKSIIFFIIDILSSSLLLPLPHHHYARSP